MSSQHNIAIKLWLEMLTGYSTNNVISAKSNGQKPDTDYAMFTLLSSITSDYPLEEKIEEEGTDAYDQRLTHRDRVTYQVDVFADDGDSILNKMWASKGVKEIRAVLKSGGLTISRKSIVRNIGDQGDTGFRPRFSCDFTFLAEETLSTKDDLAVFVGMWNNYRINGIWALDHDVPVEIEP